ncbi:LysM peptidoglycan-binding domain-containing protein [bacterium]|nr:LysM peptidoglycan-binding domain-containing protein [bacterium]
MKKTLWLISILTVFGCTRVEREVIKERAIPLIAPTEMNQEVPAKSEPVVVRQEIIPLPQIIPLPLKKGETSKPRESITKQASVTHLVKKGECLWKVAEKYYQNGFRYKEIAQANQIHSPYTIYPGQSLTIPHLHLVERGESLSKIATKYYHKGTLYGAIAQANQIPSPYIIHPGQILVIPARDAISSRTEAKARIKAKELPESGQPVDEKPYQITWQEAIDKFDLPTLVKEQTKKNVQEDKFQWFETGLTNEQKLSQLIFGSGEIWNEVTCYWSSYRGYQVKDYGADQYRIVRLSECGSWAWWKEEPRGPPTELATLKVVPKNKVLPKNLVALEEVSVKKKETSFSWLAISLWIVAILVIAAVVIVPWRARRKRR